MSKVIEATCVAGVVTADTVPVPDAEILSEGVASSSGVLVMDEDKATYIAKTSPDLKETLDKLASALDNIASALSAIDGAGYIISVTGGPAPVVAIPSPPVATSDITAINTAKAEIESFMENLK
jgi:hypothetical protein